MVSCLLLVFVFKAVVHKVFVFNVLRLWLSMLFTVVVLLFKVFAHKIVFLNLLRWWIFLLCLLLCMLFLLLLLLLLFRFLLLLLLVHWLLLRMCLLLNWWLFWLLRLLLFGLLWSWLMLLARLFFIRLLVLHFGFKSWIVVEVVVFNAVVKVVVFEVMLVSSFFCVSHLVFGRFPWFPVCFWLPTPKPQQQTKKQTSVCQKIQHCFFAVS